MAEDLQESKVVSLDDSEAKLESQASVSWSACGIKKTSKWHIGSTVYYLGPNFPCYTCLDEFEEGDLIQGTFRSHQFYILFFDPQSNRYYVIPKAKINSEGNNFPGEGNGFITRRNKTLWLRFTQVEIPEFPIELRKCPICSSDQDQMISLSCGHVTHLNCLAAKTRIQKVFRCPFYLCQKPLSDEGLIRHILQI